MKKVLGIFAHPDDEIIWGWPLLQDDGLEKHLIVVSDNHTGYGKRALAALDLACRVMGVETSVCLNFQSEFYRLPTRRAELTLPVLVERLVQAIDEIVSQISPDVVTTHNPFGEYGHGDHRLVFNVVTSYFADKVGVTYTDACQLNQCHLSFDKIPTAIRDAYFRNKISEHVLDEKWFEEVKNAYVRHRAWSWGKPHFVSKKVGLYKI